MPNVRLSGKISGNKDSKRKERAEILYHLFANGWNIYNGNGDQTTHLENIQEKIIEADAFVFTTNPDLQDYFNLASVFVGFQTLDGDLRNKPAVLMNSDGSWDSFLQIMDHMHSLGTVREKYSQYLQVVKTTDELVEIMNNKQQAVNRTIPEIKKVSAEPDIISAGTIAVENSDNKIPDYNVCVFCSASISKPDYLHEGYELGKELAKKGWGCISGAGKTGIMGQVVKGAYQNGGWSGGSNVPHIIQLEGLPEGLSQFWPRADIYTRMLVMIEKSDAFIIMPGGMGTFQELLAMLLLKHHRNDLMKGKKIIMFNRFDNDTGKNFWQPAVDLIRNYSDFDKEFEVTDDFTQLLKRIGPR